MSTTVRHFLELNRPLNLAYTVKALFARPWLTPL